MNPRFFSTRIGNELPPDYVVTWNGTHDKALAQYWQAQAQGKPVHHGFGQPLQATANPDSTRDCDRVLRYLVTNPEQAHSARSVSDALGVDIRNASVWLARFTKRGLLVRSEVPRGFMGSRAGCVYRVRPLPTP